METPTNTTTTSTTAPPPPPPPPTDVVDESTVVGMVMQQPVTTMEDREKLMKVMVAIDESDQGFHALRWALDHLSFAPPTLSTDSSGEANQKVGMITIVHVQEPFQQYIFPAGPGGTAFYATSAVAESVKKAQQENSAIILARALQMCKEKNVKAETLILNGDPKDMICQATEQMHIDLLVVGSRGLGKIKRAFLGSVSDYCAHHAKCPILIVRPPMEANK